MNEKKEKTNKQESIANNRTNAVEKIQTLITITRTAHIRRRRRCA